MAYSIAFSFLWFGIKEDDTMLLLGADVDSLLIFFLTS